MLSIAALPAWTLRLQVVDDQSLAILEEPDRTAGQYRPRGVADPADPPCTLCVGHRFYVSGTRDHGAFELLTARCAPAAVSPAPPTTEAAVVASSPLGAHEGSRAVMEGAPGRQVKRQRRESSTRPSALDEAPFGLLRVDSPHMEADHNR